MSYFFRFHGESFTGQNYKDIYLKTPHWQKLTEKHIYTNKNACCFICEKTSTLLLHHERYDNLFHERLYKDVFIVCFDCHTQIHFYTFLFFWKRKTKLSYWRLKRKRLFLRMLFCVQKRRIGLSVWYFLRYLFVL